MPGLQPETATQATMSLGARLFNVFATPGEVYDQVKAAPFAASNWLVPALLLVLVSWLGMGLVLSQPAIKQQLTEITDKQLEKSAQKANLSAERAEQMRHFAELSTKVVLFAGPVIQAFGFPLIWGLYVWLAGNHLMSGSFGYLKAVEAVGLSNMIAVLEALVRSLLIVVTASLFATPSLALLVKDFDPQNPQHAAFALVNVMSLWLLVVRSIGLARLAGGSIARAALWVFGFWILYTGFFWGVGAAARAAARM